MQEGANGGGTNQSSNLGDDVGLPNATRVGKGRAADDLDKSMATSFGK